MVKELGGEVLLLKLLEELCSDNKGSQEHLRVACGAFLNTIADHGIVTNEADIIEM